MTRKNVHFESKEATITSAIRKYKTAHRFVKKAKDCFFMSNGETTFYRPSYQAQIKYLEKTFSKHFDNSKFFSEEKEGGQENVSVPNIFKYDEGSISTSVNFALTKDQVIPEHFNSIFPTFTQHPAYCWVKHAIDEGLRYIQERENDPSRRDLSLEPYNKLDVPRYYVVYFVSKYLLMLSHYDISDEIVSEYIILLEFIENVDKDKKKIFKKTSENYGFWDYLRNIKKTVEITIEVNIASIKRKPITDLLKETVMNITPYQENLAQYLLRCLSTELRIRTVTFLEMRGTVGNDDPTIENNKTIQLLRLSLTDQVDYLEKLLDDSSFEIPDEFSLLNVSTRNQINLHYKNLFRYMQRFNDMTNSAKPNYQILIDYGLQWGTLQFVRNISFKNTLNYELSSLEEILKKCSHSISAIEKAYDVIEAKQHKNKKGYSENANSARLYLDSLRQLHIRIYNGIEKIRSKLGALESVTTDVSNAEVKLLQNTLARMKDDKRIGLNVDSNLERSCEVALSLAKTRRHTHSSYSYINKHISVDEMRKRFPLPCETLNNRDQLINIFSSYVCKIEFEYDEALNFIEQVNEINTLCQNAISALDMIEKLNIKITKSDYQEIDGLSKSIEAATKQINYGNMDLRNFKCIDKISFLIEVGHAIEPHLRSLAELFEERGSYPDHLDESSKRKRIKRLVIKTKNERCLTSKFTKIEKEIHNLATKIVLPNEDDINFHIKDRITKLKKSIIPSSPILLQENEYKQEESEELRQSDEYSPTDSLNLESLSLESLIEETYKRVFKEPIKEVLSNLYTRLLNRSYNLHYKGGEIIESDESKYKVPRNVKIMLEAYENNIEKANSIEDYQAIRELPLN